MLEYQYSKIGSYICHVAKEPPTSLNGLLAWGRLVARNEEALAIRGRRRRMGVLACKSGDEGQQYACK
jgi:hypothetical protein